MIRVGKMNQAIINQDKIPAHIAIIMDGNGRWAKKRGMPRNFGHQKGALNLRNIIDACIEFGVKVLTVFAFSTENWNRPAQEVDFLMKLAIDFFENHRKEAAKRNIKIRIIGERDHLNQELIDKIDQLERETFMNTGFTFVVALNYGSQKELVHVTKEIATQVQLGTLSISEIDENTITNNLYTKDLPPVDLLIRTSGEERISNFMLWQIAYSEIYFTTKLWPDFHKSELKKAIISYQLRERRFGGLGE